MKLMINDANILIDLLKIDLLSLFFQLPFEFHIADMVLAEVQEENTDELIKFVTNDQLLVNSATFKELLMINEFKTNNGNLSIPDCSCLYLAQKLSATLLTGDGALRKTAIAMEVDVHGILWILDELLIEKKLSPTMAIKKLKLLTKNNKRLPAAEIDKRLKEWLNMVK